MRIHSPMAEVIIRNLDEVTVSALKARAAARGHSLEQELRLLLGEAARPTRDQVRETAASIRGLTKGQVSMDLEELIRPLDTA
jgi:plasmid stability protein